VGRREQHPEESILDAARAVVVQRGARAATIGAIAEASRAPTGSIYHRFGSLQELLARLWIRAVRRSQQAALRGVDAEDPMEALIDGALGTYDFCLEQPEDARLLALFRREDFLTSDLPPGLLRELDHLNEPAMEAAKRLTRQIFGRTDRVGVDLVLCAVIDLPYGFARRYVESGDQPPGARRAALASAVRAISENVRSG
jgi:AcrR family transcriptional regulator